MRVVLVVVTLLTLPASLHPSPLPPVPHHTSATLLLPPQMESGKRRPLLFTFFRTLIGRWAGLGLCTKVGIDVRPCALIGQRVLAGDQSGGFFFLSLPRMCGAQLRFTRPASLSSCLALTAGLAAAF